MEFLDVPHDMYKDNVARTLTKILSMQYNTYTSCSAS